MSTLRIGLTGSNQSSRDRFIVSSLDAINRPLSARPSFQWSTGVDMRRRSRRGSVSPLLTTVKIPQKRKVLKDPGPCTEAEPG
ncbi:hypothetical protein UY3_06429 [Chelonia mydas]|uniref:Uncharacterized protein n=1 Tax=Chelonia mydas TaxID=8469 RepID=M7C7A4_CHEMY|nr:hypothetical protein UY3_06429 [Chelonia mydas]